MKKLYDNTWYTKHELLMNLIVAGILAAIVFLIGEALLQTNTRTETILLQIVQIVLVLIATIIPTRIFVRKEEKRINENRARMALRRTMTLDSQMRQVSEYISDQKLKLKKFNGEGVLSEDIALDAIESIEAMHNMQYGQIQAVAEDWADILPENITSQGEINYERQ